MAHKVETMAYNSAEKPWHGLGFPVSNKLTAAAMLKAAKCDWTVSKQPLYLGEGFKHQLVDGAYALMRDTDQSVLDTVGEVYKPVQNTDAFGFFKEFVAKAEMEMETAGSLWGGRYVWGLAKIGKDLKIGGKDEVRGYLLLMSPHIHGKSLVIDLTPIRVVCWNTLNFALGGGLKGSKKAFRMSHATAFSEAVQEQAKIALGLATAQMEEFGEAAGLLAKKKAKKEEVEEYFFEVLRFDPKKAKADGKVKKDGEVKEPQMLPHLRQALLQAPGFDVLGGTWWSALNAVTYTIDHNTSKDKDTALKNIWVGHKADVKRRALDLALQRAA